jgi:hypothetical protein
MAREDQPTGYDDDGVFHWNPEDRRLRQDGMGEHGERLMPGDILEDGSEWYVGWPDPRPLPEEDEA